MITVAIALTRPDISTSTCARSDALVPVIFSIFADARYTNASRFTPLSRPGACRNLRGASILTRASVGAQDWRASDVPEHSLDFFYSFRIHPARIHPRPILRHMPSSRTQLLTTCGRSVSPSWKTVEAWR